MLLLKTVMVLLAVMVSVIPSIQMSVRRQLDSVPSTTSTNGEVSAMESQVSAMESQVSAMESQDSAMDPQTVESSSVETPSQSPHHQEGVTAKELQQPSMDIPTIDQILDLLTRTVGDQNVVPDNINVDLARHSSSRAGELITGNPRIDGLLAGLREPSDNSRAVWMALLHGLMSDGSLNELLGNFVQESPSVKREGEFPGREEQGQLEGQFVDQLEGPIPQTQMEEFILEPHLGPAIMPFELPEGFFVSFLPRRAFGVVNGVSRPAHGHGSFYIHRPPGLVDVINPPAFGFLFNGYRRFEPDAVHHEDLHFEDLPLEDLPLEEGPLAGQQPPEGSLMDGHQ